MTGLRRIDYKWIVGFVFVFGIFMDLLDMTITNVALPTLAREFNTGTTGIEWVVTAYLLSLGIFIPLSGWAGDKFGTKRVFIFALAVFTAGSFLCALSWSIESLIIFRVLQGVGGGMMTPVGTAMLMRAFPPQERAAASVVLTIPTVVAPATGPVLGGYLVQYHSWHWIFLINIPIGIMGLIVAAIFLREEKQTDAGSPDLPGFFLSAFGLASILYALSRAGSYGFTDSHVIGFGLAGMFSLALFVVVELRARQPMIDVRLFSNELLRAGSIVQLVAMGGLMGGLFLLPLLLQSDMGLSPFQSGLTTFPQAIGVITMVRPASMLYRRFGPRRIMALGMVGAVVTTLAFMTVNLDSSQWWIRFIMFIRGWAFALVLVSLQTATFATIKREDQGRASAIFNAGRQIAASLGVAIVAAVLSSRLIHNGAQLGNPATRAGALTAFHEAFFVAAILATLGVVAAFLISDKAAAVTMGSRD